MGALIGGIPLAALAYYSGRKSGVRDADDLLQLAENVFSLGGFGVGVGAAAGAGVGHLVGKAKLKEFEKAASAFNTWFEKEAALFSSPEERERKRAQKNFYKFVKANNAYSSKIRKDFVQQKKREGINLGKDREFDIAWDIKEPKAPDNVGFNFAVSGDVDQHDTEFFDVLKNKQMEFVKDYYRKNNFMPNDFDITMRSIKKASAFDALFEKTAVIARTSEGFQVRSEDGRNLSAPDLTEEEAKERLRQVECFKWKDKQKKKKKKKNQSVSFKEVGKGKSYAVLTKEDILQKPVTVK